MRRRRAGLVLAFGLAALSSARGDDKKKPAPRPDPARLERAREWTQALIAKPSPIDKLHASWNLEALSPESVEAIVDQVDQGRLGSDALVATTHGLGELGSPRALATLAGVVEDEKKPIPARIAALVAVAKLLTPDSSKVLARVAEGPSGPFPRMALVALGKTNDPATAGIAEKWLARKDEPEDRAFALRAVGHAQDARFIPQCLAALDDPDGNVRIQAARSLGRMGTPAVADKLEKVFPKLQGPDRYVVAEALARLGRQKGLDALVDYLEHGEPLYQLAAATGLFDVANPKSLPALRRVVSEPDAGRASGIDLMCMATLGALQDKEAVPLLAKILASGRIDAKRDAAAALGLIGDKKATEPLLGAVRAPDRRIRASALVALAQVGDRKAWSNEVSQALKDRDPMVRYAGCVALELGGDKGALGELKPLLDDAHDFVAKAARLATTKLEGGPPAPVDPRDPLHLDRLRGIEREFLLKVQLDQLAASVERRKKDTEYNGKPRQGRVALVDIVDT